MMRGCGGSIKSMPILVSFGGTRDRATGTVPNAVRYPRCRSPRQTEQRCSREREELHIFKGYKRAGCPPMGDTSEIVLTTVAFGGTSLPRL